MRFWRRTEPVIICYHCRKHVSEQELAAGVHDHYDEQDPRPLAPAADSSAAQ